MEVKLIERDEFIVGGFSVETTLENSARDTEILFNDFYNGKMESLSNFAKNAKEYYGVMWYTKLHEKYRYFVGQEISEIVKGFEIKIIPKGLYAYTKLSKDCDGIQAWTDFYSEAIPKTGYAPKEIDDMAFEYYPNGFDDDYELWSLVEKRTER